jgi:hypothetical protein
VRQAAGVPRVSKSKGSSCLLPRTSHYDVPAALLHRSAPSRDPRKRNESRSAPRKHAVKLSISLASPNIELAFSTRSITFGNYPVVRQLSTLSSILARQSPSLEGYLIVACYIFSPVLRFFGSFLYVQPSTLYLLHCTCCLLSEGGHRSVYTELAPTSASVVGLSTFVVDDSSILLWSDLGALF